MQVICIYENRFLRRLKNNKIEYGEEFAKLVLKDKNLTRKTVFVMANLLSINKVVLASNGIGAIDKAGSMLLSICKRFGYWIALIMCVVEIIKSLMQNDTKSISKIVVKYVIAYASFYFLPWIFTLIEECFK